eukprot:2822790-Alexandrium_andersonii.AAC.1
MFSCVLASRNARMPRMLATQLVCQLACPPSLAGLGKTTNGPTIEASFWPWPTLLEQPRHRVVGGDAILQNLWDHPKVARPLLHHGADGAVEGEDDAVVDGRI